MKRRNSSSSATAAAKQKTEPVKRRKSAAKLSPEQAQQTRPELAAASAPAPIRPADAKAASCEFSVRIVHAQEARPFLETQDCALLQPDSLAFLLCERPPENASAAARHAESEEESAVLGYCLIRRKAGLAPSAQSQMRRESARPRPVSASAAPPSGYESSGGFLEIAAFRLYAALAETKAAARAKTLLLRAVADYCRRQEVEYICGQFSFAGKYPAAYAREFSCLYHYYRIKGALPQIRMADRDAERAPAVSMDIMPAEAVPPDKSRRFLPPMLRYCLKLGAKADGNVTIDRAYNHGIGAMNVFLAMPARPILKAELNPANIPKPG